MVTSVFEDTIAAALKTCLPETVVIAAVSGGADSTAMLAALAAVRQEMVFDLRCIHIEHGIRPAAESRGDAEFVQSLCKKLHVPCRVVSVAPGKIAATAKKRGIGIEAAARLYRRRAWFRYARQLEAAASLSSQSAAMPVWILTAHTADDMRETALMRILRGSGPSGLAGMAAVSAGRNRILRPLITLSRRDALEYLAEKNILWREDSTNTDIRFLRNRIRHRLIPLLNEHFPHWRGAITALAETQSLAAAFIREEAALRIRWQPLIAHSLFASAENFFAQPAIIREEALFQGIDMLMAALPSAAPPCGIRRVNIRRFSEGNITAVDMGRLQLRRDSQRVIISPRSPSCEYGFSLLIKAPGSYILKEIAIEVSETGSCEENGAFLTFLPLVLQYSEDELTLRAAPHGRRCMVRVIKAK